MATSVRRAKSDLRARVDFLNEEATQIRRDVRRVHAQASQEAINSTEQQAVQETPADSIRARWYTDKERQTGRSHGQQETSYDRYAVFKAGVTQHLDDLDAGVYDTPNLSDEKSEVAVSSHSSTQDLLKRVKGVAGKVAQSKTVREASKAAWDVSCKVGAKVKESELLEGVRDKIEQRIGKTHKPVSTYECAKHPVAFRVARVVEILNTLEEENTRQAREITKLKSHMADLVSDIAKLQVQQSRQMIQEDLQD